MSEVEGSRLGLELANDDQVLLWRSIDRAVFSVGRNPECDLCVLDDRIGPIQCLLRYRDGKVTLVNRHERGTRVGDETIAGERLLQVGESITLGSMVAELRPERRKTAPVTKTLRPAPGEPIESVTVLVPGTGASWALDDAGLTIGHDASNDIRLDDPYVSRFHARLALEDGRPVVRDTGSRNGVYVGERRIADGEVLLNESLRFGETLVVLRSKRRAAAKSRPATVLVGDSPAIVTLRGVIDKVSASDAPVLITGESGTGKELAARMVYERSARKAAPYLAINCGALAADLIESELFGHVAGSFTGATQSRKGAFEAANGGTLFLDEIAELPLPLQAQLLRVVDNHELRRVGSNELVKVDVRLITATNSDLSTAVRTGCFRADLFHRLNVLNVAMPALRTHREDIPALTRHFLDELVPGENVELSAAAQEALMAWDWSGNVRDLRNTMQRAVVHRNGGTIEVGQLTFCPSTHETRIETKAALTGRTLADIEQDAIEQSLRQHGGNQKAAAAALGISRSTIHRRLIEYGINAAELVEDAGD